MEFFLAYCNSFMSSFLKYNKNYIKKQILKNYPFLKYIVRQNNSTGQMMDSKTLTRCRPAFASPFRPFVSFCLAIHCRTEFIRWSKRVLITSWNLLFVLRLKPIKLFKKEIYKLTNRWQEVDEYLHQHAQTFAILLVDLHWFVYWSDVTL